MKKCLYEILVPTKRNDGRPIRTRFHRVWDGKIREVVGGLTVMGKSINGEWLSGEGIIYREQMIPVRIMCTPNEIFTIARITQEHYEQEAVMFYKLSDEVVVFNKDTFLTELS